MLTITTYRKVGAFLYCVEWGFYVNHPAVSVASISKGEHTLGARGGISFLVRNAFEVFRPIFLAPDLFPDRAAAQLCLQT